jgi:hypothetical protein
VEANIWGAFSAIGFSYDIMKNPYGLPFDEEKVRQSRGFLELWAPDIPWRVCRRGVDSPSLNGLTNLIKSVWSKKLAIASTGNEDMQPTGSLEREHLA